MREYEDYVQKLKSVPAEPDFDLLEQRIRAQASRQKLHRRLVASGALLVFILAAAVSYIYLPQFRGGEGNVLLSYVYESPGSLDGPVLDYVLIY